MKKGNPESPPSPFPLKDDFFEKTNNNKNSDTSYFWCPISGLVASIGTDDPSHFVDLSLQLGRQPSLSLASFNFCFSTGAIKTTGVVCLLGVTVAMGTYLIYKLYRQFWPPFIFAESNDSIKKINVDSKEKKNKLDSPGKRSQFSIKSCDQGFVSMQTSEEINQKQQIRRSLNQTMTLKKFSKSSKKIKSLPVNIHSTEEGFFQRPSLSDDQAFLRSSSSLEDSPEILMMSTPNLPFHNYSNSSAWLRIQSLKRGLRDKTFLKRGKKTEKNLGKDADRFHSTPDSMVPFQRLQSPESQGLFEEEFQKQEKQNFIENSKFETSNESHEVSSDSLSLASPIEELFVTANEVGDSQTVSHIEYIQNQLDMISSEMGDLNEKVDCLQKREEEAISRRYTLGTTEALDPRGRRRGPGKVEKRKRTRTINNPNIDYFNDMIHFDSYEQNEKNKEKIEVEGEEREEIVDVVKNLVESEDFLWEGRDSDSNIDLMEEEEEVKLRTKSDYLNEENNQNFSTNSKKLFLSETKNKSSMKIERNVKTEEKKGRVRSISDICIKKTSKKKLNLSDDFYIDDELMFDEDEFSGGAPSSLEPHLLDILNNNFRFDKSKESKQTFKNSFNENSSLYQKKQTSKDEMTKDSPNITNHTKIEKIIFFSGLNKTNGFLPNDPPNFHNNPILQTLLQFLQIFPHWKTPNVSNRVSINSFFTEFPQTNKQNQNLINAYKQINRLLDGKDLCVAKGDLFSPMRATLWQGMRENKFNPLTSYLSVQMKKFLEILESEDCEFMKKIVFNKKIPTLSQSSSFLETARHLLLVLQHILSVQKSINDSKNQNKNNGQSSEWTVEAEEELEELLEVLFNGNPMVDLFMMEASKVLMVLNSILLYKSFLEDPSNCHYLAWNIFAQKQTSNPELLFKNRLRYLGDVFSFCETDLCLLGFSFKVKLKVIHPEKYFSDSQSFITHHPEDEEVFNPNGNVEVPKIILVKNCDKSFSFSV